MSDLKKRLHQEMEREPELRETYFSLVDELCELASKMEHLDDRFSAYYSDIDDIYASSQEEGVSDEVRDYIEERVVGQIHNEAPVFDEGIPRIANQLQELCELARGGQLPPEA